MDCRVGDEKREEALWLTLIAIWGWLGIAHTGLVWVALQHCDTVITLYHSESVTLQHCVRAVVSGGTVTM